MEENLYNEPVALVFKYLDDIELENAAKVCRFWWKIAYYEMILRGPICITRNKMETDSFQDWYLVKTKISRNYKSRLCLNIFFSNKKSEQIFKNSCCCLCLPSRSYSVLLENDILMETHMENILSSFFLPITSKTKITTFTFIKQIFLGGLFCQEIRFNCGNDIRKVKFLKYKLQDFFRNDNWPPSCMIILCTASGIFQFIDLLIILKEWFPESEICIWGGITERLSVCQVCFNKRFCNIDTVFTLIFVSNPFMETWTELLDAKCNTSFKIKEKLRMLKQRIKLKFYNIALMHISINRLAYFYTIDVSLFKEIFPEVQLFPIYGRAIFQGNGLRDFFENIPIRTINNDSFNTSIMIITYN